MQLIESLVNIEQQHQQSDRHDFWLLQYQKLLDAQPQTLSLKSANIDPLLGYNFLLNDVVHCLPFLFKIWQTKKDLSEINDDDLTAAGVHNRSDRTAILQSIYDYVHQKIDAPTANVSSVVFTPAEVDKSIGGGASKSTVDDNRGGGGGETLAECVVCMEESVCIFGFTQELFVILSIFIFWCSAKLSFYHAVICVAVSIVMWHWNCVQCADVPSKLALKSFSRNVCKGFSFFKL